MIEIITSPICWVAVLLSAAGLLLYAALSRRGHPLIALAVQLARLSLYLTLAQGKIVDGFYYVAPMSVPLGCAVDGLLRARGANWWTWVALAAAGFAPLALAGVLCSGNPFSPSMMDPLFLFPTAAIYALPLWWHDRPYGGTRNCVLWFVIQGVLIALLALSRLTDFNPHYETIQDALIRSLVGWNGIFAAIWMIPVLASLPAFFYNLRCVKRGAST